MVSSKSVTPAVQVIAVAVLVAWVHVDEVAAQQPGYAGYTATYPQQYPGQDSGMSLGAPPRGRFRDIFAGTLALVLQSTGAGVAARISQGLTGSIAGWFNPGQPRQGYGPNAYSGGSGYEGQMYPGAAGVARYPNGAAAVTGGSYATGGAYPNANSYPNGGGGYASSGGYTNSAIYPNSGAYPNSSAYPNSGTTPGSSAYPNSGATPSSGTYPNSGTYPGTSAYPSVGTYPNTGGYPGTDAAASEAQTPDQSAYSSMGAVPGTTTLPPATTTDVKDAYAAYGATNSSNDVVAASPGSSGLYAGMAYEVHVVGSDGHDTPVDPATYTFSTGDRFFVYYRPSLPGTVEIFNINPLGKTTRIDSTNIAAGQLATLGPYQFTDNKGDEALRLVMSPCTDSGLLTTTRDIVKVGSESAASGGVALPSCGSPVTRGIKPKTRNIRKVGIDGGTSYALDPISQQEVSSGQYAPRNVTITFHHR